MTGYLGSKAASGLYRAIIALMPAHETFIETHYGSGVVSREKPAARRSVAIDLDASLFDRFPPPAGTEIHTCDAVRWLEEHRPGAEAVIYCDPPYVLATRTSAHRYPHDYVDADHERLIETLIGLDARVLLSGYPSALYERLIPASWRAKDFRVMTRGGPRTERLWLNFPEGAPHWHRFAGKNFTDRQRIQRKAGRWAKNFQKCPEAERLAILEAILADDPPGCETSSDT